MKDIIRFIRSSGISFVFSVLAIMLGVFLVEGSVFLRVVSDEARREIKQSFKMNVSLSDSVNEQKISQIDSSLLKLKNVGAVEFISKEKAAQRFIAETGEDFREVLKDNPLPASFLITLKNEVESKASVDSLAMLIKKIEGVEYVDFPENYFVEFSSFSGRFEKYLLVAIIVLLCSAVYIVYSTLRLIMLMRSEEIEIMKLVGSTIARIRKPAIYYGIIIGVLGGLSSLGLWEIIRQTGNTLIGSGFYEFSRHIIKVYPYALIGPVLGLIGSYLSVRKLTLNL